DEARLPEEAKVFGDGRTGLAKAGGQLVHRCRPGAQTVQQGSARRIADCPEDVGGFPGRGHGGVAPPRAGGGRGRPVSTSVFSPERITGQPALDCLSVSVSRSKPSWTRVTLVASPTGASSQLTRLGGSSETAGSQRARWEISRPRPFSTERIFPWTSAIPPAV